MYTVQYGYCVQLLIIVYFTIRLLCHILFILRYKICHTIVCHFVICMIQDFILLCILNRSTFG